MAPRGAKGGRFRILAMDGGETLRKLGALKGKFVISEEFDEEAASLTVVFEGCA